MTSRTILSALLPVAVLTTLACSKTQDTAPERRVFGDPPTIQSVDPVFYNSEAEAKCDFTDVVLALFCENGIANAEPQTGRGWTVVFGPGEHDRNIVFSDQPTTEPGIFLEGTYGELTFKVKVTDPNSITGGQNNVLLTSASFVQPESKTETTLVLFDDGSFNQFPFEQRVIGTGEACEYNPTNGVCDCRSAVYQIKSGDVTPGDDFYTRKFALANPKSSPYLQDCIMRSKNEVPFFAPAGSTFSFKIEAVDRQGNLTTWPNKLDAVAPAGSFVCNGDSCGCCILHTFSQLAETTECKNQPGMIVPGSYPNGFCIDGL